jgi:sugar diacid utilization regulator
VSADLRHLVERLQPDAERHVPQIVALNRALPELRDICDEGFWEDVEEVARLNVPLFYRVMLDGWSPTENEVAANRRYTRRCVERGISLASHLATYREGMWILWNHLVQEVLRSCPALRGELLLRTVWVLRQFEAVYAVLSQAYYAEQEGQTRHRRAALRDLFEEILQGSPSTAEELRGRAAAQRIDFDARYQLVVVETKPGKGAPRGAALEEAIARATDAGAGGVVAVERGREVVYFARPCASGGPDDRLRASLTDVVAEGARGEDGPADVCVAISGSLRDVDGIRRGYREARRALELGPVLDPGRRIWSYSELALDDLLTSNPLAGQRLVEEALGPLLACGASGRRCLESLEAYFRAGLCLKEAAANLGIHPNSLLYRMKQMRRIAGIDPADAEQRLRLEAALRIRRREPDLCENHKETPAGS